MLPIYKTDYALPNTENLGFRGINLPSGPRLTDEQIEEVASIIKDNA